MHFSLLLGYTFICCRILFHFNRAFISVSFPDFFQCMGSLIVFGVVLDQLAKRTFCSRYAHTPWIEWRTDGQSHITAYHRVRLFCAHFVGLVAILFTWLSKRVVFGGGFCMILFLSHLMWVRYGISLYYLMIIGPLTFTYLLIKKQAHEDGKTYPKRSLTYPL